MNKRVLIGSCGGLTGCYLARQFRKAGCFVIGADATSGNMTRPFLDDFVLLPGASSESFLPALLTVLRERRVDCYIPTHSKEIRRASECESVLRAEWDGFFLVSPYETFLALDDKRAANASLSAIGIPVPCMISAPSPELQYPIFMKPNRGSGSSRTRTVETAVLHREYVRIDPDCCFYEKINGTEYTVDCMFDANGQLLGFNQRIRVKSMGGAVITTRGDDAFDIVPYLETIAAAYTIKGCVNFQYILSGGTPYFIDINLRYASGGLPLSVESGLNVPHILLDLADGKAVAPLGNVTKTGKTMYRYFEEWYEDAQP